MMPSDTTNYALLLKLLNIHKCQCDQRSLFLHTAYIYRGRIPKLFQQRQSCVYYRPLNLKATVQISFLRNGNLDMFRICYIRSQVSADLPSGMLQPRTLTEPQLRSSTLWRRTGSIPFRKEQCRLSISQLLMLPGSASDQADKQRSLHRQLTLKIILTNPA